MSSVKTVWEWSVETEAKRLIHTAHNIATGFFRVNNFFVVPAPLRSNLCPAKVRPCTTCVPFPELSYQTIPRFWERVKRADIKNFPLEFETFQGPTLEGRTFGESNKLGKKQRQQFWTKFTN